MIRSRVLIHHLNNDSLEGVPHELFILLRRTVPENGSHEAGLKTLMDVSRNDSPKYLLCCLEFAGDLLNSNRNNTDSLTMDFLSNAISNSFCKVISEKNGDLNDRILVQTRKIIHFTPLDSPSDPETSNSAIVLRGALLSLIFGLQDSKASYGHEDLKIVHKWSQQLRLALDETSVCTYNHHTTCPLLTLVGAFRSTCGY